MLLTTNYFVHIVNSLIKSKENRKFEFIQLKIHFINFKHFSICIDLNSFQFSVVQFSVFFSFVRTRMDKIIISFNSCVFGTFNVVFNFSF